MSAQHHAHLQRRLVESDVPEALHDGLVHYIAERRHVGHFLTAVLSNDLREACARADDICRQHLYAVVFFLYNYAPSNCWGSSTAVERWLNHPDPAPEVFE